MAAEVIPVAASIVGVCFVGAALIAAVAVLRSGLRLSSAVGLATVVVCALLVFFYWAEAPASLFLRTPWARVGKTELGIGLYVDDLSLLFATLVAGISVLSLFYSLRYIPHEMMASEGHGGQGRPPLHDSHEVAAFKRSRVEAAYYGYMLLFTGSMLGMVFAGDLIQLYLFWELTGIASFLLIGLNWSDPGSRHGAVKALLITGLGGLLMLVGLILAGSAAGSFAIPEVLERGELLRSSPLFGLMLLLLVAGAAAKSAQFPFHVWLPDAMVAPTPVSAFLHSAALVAAGVYLLSRFHPVFSADPLWQWSLAGSGLASMLLGGVLALKARTFKAILAYSTISQYGIIFALLGYGGGGALAAGLFSFFQHGLIKAGLFLAAGAVTYATGLKEIGGGGGLWSRLPAVFLACGALALSLAGLPPLAGFWMKEGFLGATLETGSAAMTVLGLVAGALTLTYMLRFLAGSFVTGAAAPPRMVSPPVSMLAAPGALALLTVLFGLAPGLAGVALVEPAARAVAGVGATLKLTLHLDPTLLLSLLALGLGAAAYAAYPRWAVLVDRMTRRAWSLDRLYGALSSGAAAAGRLALQLQSGFLRSYLQITLVGLAALMAYSALPALSLLPLPAPANASFPPQLEPHDWAMAMLLVLVSAGTILTFVVRRHLHVVLALSAVGYLIGGVFALEFAPDVGLVQVHVETLVTVLFVLALVLIPLAVRRPFVLRARDRLGRWGVTLAALGGTGSAWLSWMAMEHAAADPIAPWFNDNALELTHASDVVAAILVDFRALDTLGEITVFAISALGIYALVRLIRREEE